MSFRFKQFVVSQDKCAMKVGTDGVLIGAWCSCVGAINVLDVGCGTGLISLMVAQRNDKAVIDAVEIDVDAAEQSRGNFEKSDWFPRLNVYNMSFQEYISKSTKKYDFIVSNPPYFIDSLKNSDVARMSARHTDKLPYEDLIYGVVNLLAEDGVFSAIFPYEEANIFVAKAAASGLYCVKRMDVKGVVNKPIKRVMLEFSRVKSELISDSMFIEGVERHSYSQKYIDLTKDFYLKF